MQPNQTKARQNLNRVGDIGWEIYDADLAIFRRVARGANPLIARHELIARSWSETDADDFIKLALSDSEVRD